MEAVVTGGPLEARLVLNRSDDFSVDVDLSVPPGVTAALLGPNGAGKTTTMSAIAGLLAVDEGSVRLGSEIFDDPGKEVFVPPHRRPIGVVFQEYLLFPHLTVLDNITFGLRSRGTGRTRSAASAREWMSRLGLDGMEDKLPGELSGGQAQRVALARALVIEPRMLLLDEPLSALDVTTRVELRRVLADHLRDFEGPRLLITHDPTEAFLLADEIYVIEAGVITQVGTADEIRLRPRTKYAADLAGSNLIFGTADDGRVDANTLILSIADHDVSGPVLLTIHPTAISVHLEKPEGSQRNIWRTAVEVVENLGDRARLQTGGPLSLTVEVTREASSGLSL
ncbi:MAG TPA: ABC transporter ATP-binding protein, partial [Acidimicrobiia bacterium]|nr:ABC transporter ATP-binding protein [Acidimicrobiia bacterium]